MRETSRQVRDSLEHPVLDVDGHVIEFMPAVLPYLREAMGPGLFEKYVNQPSPIAKILGADTETRAQQRTPQSAWWGTPAQNTRDLATGAIPGLMYERLDDLGSDKTQPLYQRPWAMASDTPFKFYKLWPYAGGVQTPFVVSWPAGIQKPGLRQQFVDVIDITAL